MTKWRIQGRNGSLHISKRRPTNYMEWLQNAGKTVSQNKRSTGRVSYPGTSPVGRRGVHQLDGGAGMYEFGSRQSFTASPPYTL